MKILTITDDQFAVLLKTLSDRFEAIVSERFAQVYKSIENVQFTLDRFGSEGSNDRKDIADMKIHMATIAQQLKETVELINHQERTIGNKVEDTVNKTVDTVSQTVSDNVKPAVAEILTRFARTNGDKLHLPRKHFWQIWR
jgi:hypothetical protein